VKRVTIRDNESKAGRRKRTRDLSMREEDEAE
jgi:hypothetical protein